MRYTGRNRILVVDECLVLLREIRRSKSCGLLVLGARFSVIEAFEALWSHHVMGCMSRDKN